MARNSDKGRINTRSEEQLPSGAAQTDTPDSGRAFDEGELSRRAYRKFEERGYEHGHDVEDWLDAERELRQPPSKSEGGTS